MEPRAAGGAVYMRGRDGKHSLIGRKTRRVVAVGVTETHQRKRFHIHETVQRVAKRIPEICRAKLRKLNK